jgi:hypothetical protein
VVQPADEEIDDGRIDPSGKLRWVATDRGPDDREDARSDDGTNAERGERDGAEGLVESVLRPLRVGYQLVDGLGGEDLPGQRGVLC